jgi:hypothetical protein
MLGGVLTTGDLIAISVAVVSAGWSYHHRRSDDDRGRVQRVIDLYRQYHSSDLLNARHHAWYWLEDIYEHRPVVVWQQLWNARDPSVRENVLEAYKVLSFWHTLYSLDKEGLIDRGLARELLAYQFRHWKARFLRLARDTFADNADPDDALRPYVDDRLAWLESAPNPGNQQPSGRQSSVDEARHARHTTARPPA